MAAFQIWVADPENEIGGVITIEKEVVSGGAPDIFDAIATGEMVHELSGDWPVIMLFDMHAPHNVWLDSWRRLKRHHHGLNHLFESVIRDLAIKVADRPWLVYADIPQAAKRAEAEDLYAMNPPFLERG